MVNLVDLDEAMRIAGERSRSGKAKASAVDLSDQAIMQKFHEKLAELRIVVAWMRAMGIEVRWTMHDKDSTINPLKDNQQITFAIPRPLEVIRKLER